MLPGSSARAAPDAPGQKRVQEEAGTGDFNEADPKLLDAVGAYLQQRAEEGIDMVDDPATVFDAASPPEITVREYLNRLVQYADCSQECYVMAAIYSDRVGMAITPANVHRLLLAGLVLAAKWRDDFYFSNDFYSLVGGVSLTEVNRLELELLDRVNWRAHVTEQQYERELRRYMYHHALKVSQEASLSPTRDSTTSLRSAISHAAWTHYDDALPSDRSSGDSDADSSSYQQQGHPSPESGRRPRREKVHPQPCWRRIVSWLHRNGYH